MLATSPAVRGVRRHALSVGAIALAATLPIVGAAATAALIGGFVALGADHPHSSLVFLGPLVGIAIRAAWKAVPTRRDGGPTAAAGQPLAGEPDLLNGLIAESAALGLTPVDAVHATLDHELTIVRVRTERGRKRVLVVGLPLALELSEAQLRAGLARVLLDDADRVGRLLRGRVARMAERASAAGAPWRGYGRITLGVTAAALRERALASDAAVARRHGAAATVGYVRAGVHRQAYAEYWTHQVAVSLAAGFHPPIAEGWLTCLDEPGFAESVSADVARVMSAAPGAFDASPRLADRVRVIESVAEGAGAALSGQRLRLTGDPALLERAILVATGRDDAAMLVPVPWSRAAEAVWLPLLRAEVEREGEQLDGLEITDLQKAIAAAIDDERAGASLDGLGAALAVALADAGWTLRIAPGRSLVAERGDFSLSPLSVPHHLAHNDDEGWAQFVAEAEIQDLALAPARPSSADGVSASVGPGLQEVAVPARGVTVALRRPRAFRRRTVAILGAAWVTFGTVALGMVGEAVAVPMPAGARVFVALMACALIGALAAWTRVRRQVGWVAGSLTIAGDTLRIDHPGHLREPFVITRTALRLAAIDDGNARDPMGRKLRFPLAHAAWDDPNSVEASADWWLWSSTGALLVPEIGIAEEPPNLALLFSAPVVAPRVRRRSPRGPLPGEALTGLLVAVDDVHTAVSALSEWGVLRALTMEDLKLIDDAHHGRPPRTATVN